MEVTGQWYIVENHDGKKDILLAGNNEWTRIKFGRYCANHGVVLLGNGKGDFKYATQTESGLNIRGNVRSLLAQALSHNLERTGWRSRLVQRYFNIKFIAGLTQRGG